MQRKWKDPRQMTRLFLFCWVAYTTNYLGRYNLSAAMADMIQRAVLTKAQGGFIATCFFISYGAGQIFSGWLGDKLNARWMVGIGLIASGCMNVAMSQTTAWQALAVFWTLNGVFQSMIWSPMLRLLAEYLPHKRRLKAGVDLSTTAPAGTVLSYALVAGGIALSSWMLAFAGIGVIMLIVGVLWLVGVGLLEKNAETELVEEEAAPRAEEAPQGSFWKIILPSGLAVIALAVMVQGALRDSITTWMPTYLTEEFDLGAQTAVIATMVLPIVNVVGVYGASWLNSHVVKDVVASAGIMFLLSMACLGILILFHPLPLVAVLLLMATAAMTTHAINTMLISLLPMYFSKMHRVSTVTGFLNAIVYVGSSISTYGIGALSDAGGWSATQIAWCTMCVAGAALCFAARRAWIPYRKKYL